MFDGRFRAPVERRLKPIGDSLRRTGITADHLTAPRRRHGRGGRGRHRPRAAARRPAACSCSPPCPTCSTAPWPRPRARRQPARRLLRLGRRPGHRHAAARRRGLVPRHRVRRSRIAAAALRRARRVALISYERAKAESLGFDAKGGLMERAERIILLGIGLLFDCLLIPILWVMLVLTAVTAVQRFVKRLEPGRGRPRRARAPGGPAQPAVRPGARRGASSHRVPPALRRARSSRRIAPSPASRPARSSPAPCRRRSRRSAGSGDRGLAGPAPARPRAMVGAPHPRVLGPDASDADVATAVRRRPSSRTPPTGWRASGCRACRRRPWTAGFDTDGYEHRRSTACAAGKGVILALPHLGGWEWAGRWLVDRDHPITAVVEPLDPPELFEWFAELRSSLGMTVVPLGPAAGSAVLRALRANEVVCLLSDRDLGAGACPSRSSVRSPRSRRGRPCWRCAPGRRCLPTAGVLHRRARRSPRRGGVAAGDHPFGRPAPGRDPVHPGPRRRARDPDPPGAPAVAPVPAQLILLRIWPLSWLFMADGVVEGDH